MTEISRQFLISEQVQDNFKISRISGISGQLGTLVSFKFLKLTELSRFVEYLWNDPRSIFGQWHTQSGPEKLAPFLYAVTFPNSNRFSQLFHRQKQEKICNNIISKRSHHTSSLSLHYLVKCQVA